MWTVFDETGRAWPNANQSLGAIFDFAVGQMDIVDYAIRNIGYVGWREHRSHAEVRFRPHVVSEIAMIAAIQRMLSSTHIARIAVSMYEKSWETSIHATRMAAVHGLSPFCNPKRDEHAIDFRSRTRRLQDLHRGSPLKAVLDRWAERTALPADVRDWAPACQRDRLIVLERTHASSAKLVFRHVGQGISIFPERWRAMADGLPANQQPDGHYGSWIVRGYEDALTWGEPVLEDIDATVDVGDGVRRRCRYRRLLLPVTTWNGASGVLGTSILDPQIDLSAEDR